MKMVRITVTYCSEPTIATSRYGRIGPLDETTEPPMSEDDLPAGETSAAAGFKEPDAARAPSRHGILKFITSSFTWNRIFTFFLRFYLRIRIRYFLQQIRSKDIMILKRVDPEKSVDTFMVVYYLCYF